MPLSHRSSRTVFGALRQRLLRVHGVTELPVCPACEQQKQPSEFSALGICTPCAVEYVAYDRSKEVDRLQAKHGMAEDLHAQFEQGEALTDEARAAQLAGMLTLEGDMMSIERRLQECEDEARQEQAIRDAVAARYAGASPDETVAVALGATLPHA